MFDSLVNAPADLADLSPAELRDVLRRAEGEIGRLRALQTRALRQLRRQYGQLSRTEISSMLDVSTATAGALFETALRTPEKSASMQKLETGTWSFDRAAAMAGLVSARADESILAMAEERDIAGIRRLRAMARRITRRNERRAYEERFVRTVPSVDDAVGFIHAQLPSHQWRVVAKALDDRAELFPRQAQDHTLEQRRADALVAMAQDWLDGTSPSGRSAGPVVTVVVDAALAAATSGEAGVAICDGPRIGPDTLDRILCEGSVEILVECGSSRPVAVGSTTRVVSPRQRSHLLARYGSCTIEGCNSRYRLQVHHIVARSEGGTHEDDNLTLLCDWHHQTAVHGMGMRIDPASPRHRRRLLPPENRPP